MKIVYNGEKDRAFKELFSELIPSMCESDDRVIYLDADLMNCIGTITPTGRSTAVSRRPIWPVSRQAFRQWGSSP